MLSRSLALALSLGLSSLASAADVYVVHGIPGDDIGQANMLPVDLAVDTVCTAQNVMLGAVAGPLTVATGERKFDLSLSDGSCTGVAAVSGRFDFAVGETAIVVAHLDQNGVPRLSKFTVDTGAIADGNARVAVIHAANAPMVDIRIREDVKKKPAKAKLNDLANGEQTRAIDVPASTYDIRVKPSAGGASVLDVNEFGVANNNVIVAIGSLRNATFTVAVVSIM